MAWSMRQCHHSTSRVAAATNVRFGKIHVIACHSTAIPINSAKQCMRHLSRLQYNYNTPTMMLYYARLRKAVLLISVVVRNAGTEIFGPGGRVVWLDGQANWHKHRVVCVWFKEMSRHRE